MKPIFIIAGIIILIVGIILLIGSGNFVPILVAGGVTALGLLGG